MGEARLDEAIGDFQAKCGRATLYATEFREEREESDFRVYLRMGGLAAWRSWTLRRTRVHAADISEVSCF